MLHFNEGSWGSIIKTMWYFPRVFLERRLIVPAVEEKPSESMQFLKPLGYYKIHII